MRQDYPIKQSDMETDHPINELHKLPDDVWHGRHNTRVAIFAGVVICGVLLLFFLISSLLAPY